MQQRFELRELFKRTRTGLIVAIVLYLSSFMIGIYVANAQRMLAVEIRFADSNAFEWFHQPFNTISRTTFQFIFPWATGPPNYFPSQVPSPSQENFAFLVLILILFASGLLFIFALTTVVGMIPVVGAIAVGLVAVVDGVSIGETFFSLLSIVNVPPVQVDVFLTSITPVLLIVIAKIVGATCGFRLALVSFRAKHGDWRSSLKDAWRDVLHIYPTVIILLAIAATIEFVVRNIQTV